MLPKSHSQAYQNLLLRLQKLETDTNGNLDRISLQEKWFAIQQVFQEQVMTLDSQELDAAIASRWQSIQTEIHRALKLMEMDIMFLLSSRGASTTETRLKSLRDRVHKIIGYCQAMLC